MFKFFVGMLLFCFTIIAMGQDATDVLKQRIQNMHSIQADFTQEMCDVHGKVNQRGNGHVDLQKPGLFRWDQQQPMQQLIVGNHGKIWIYDVDLQQVTLRNLKSSLGETPALLLSDVNPPITQYFKVNKISENLAGVTDWFKLIPKNKDSLFTSVWLGFKGPAIFAMRLQDHLGNITDIRFTSVKTNASLSHSVFQFKMPKNVDMIDETKDKRYAE